MILVPRDRLTTLAANFDVPLVIAGHSGHAIVEAQGQSQRIESGPQVGAGGRYPDGHRIAHYLRPAARAAASTSASIRASASTVNPLSAVRSEEHTSELQSRGHLVCRLLLEKKKGCLC